MCNRCWGDYTTDDFSRLSTEGGIQWWEFGEENSIIEAHPLMMLPPRPWFGWVMKVAEVKRHLGYSFKGIEQ